MMLRSLMIAPGYAQVSLLYVLLSDMDEHRSIDRVFRHPGQRS